MKKLILLEAPALTDLEKMQLFDQGRRRENVKACGVDKLINYYKICLANNLYRARTQLEDEFYRRDLKELIAPMHLLTAPSADNFTEEIARAVVDSKGDCTTILNLAYKSVFHGRVMIAAYVLALVADEPKLEQELRKAIQHIGTYDNYIKDYLDNCFSNNAIVTKLSALAKYMEDYKQWA